MYQLQAENLQESFPAEPDAFFTVAPCDFRTETETGLAAETRVLSLGVYM